MAVLSSTAEHLLNRVDSDQITWELTDLNDFQFVASYKDILKGEINLNQTFAALGCATIGDFVFSIPIVSTPLFVGDESTCGWTYDCMQYAEIPWIEPIIDCRTENNRVIFEISFNRPPCSSALNCMGWDEENCGV